VKHKGESREHHVADQQVSEGCWIKHRGHGERVERVERVERGRRRCNIRYREEIGKGVSLPE
jgi:hypothetical protein